MRLLHVTDKRFEVFSEGHIPPYVILSHRWIGNEITFQEFRRALAQPEDDLRTNLQSYHKILSFCSEAKFDSFEWVWVDTCCIDKSSSAELSEAINSMFRWYKNSQVCYAFLDDVSDATDLTAFAQSKWFTRGWTLQELLAPSVVRFFGHDWQYIGELSEDDPGMLERVSAVDKPEMLERVSAITKIPRRFLLGAPLRTASVAQRMSWASLRKTTRPEDAAYCLLGLFDINMPLVYGEGERAFFRLQEQIVGTTNDQSILAWGYKKQGAQWESKYGAHNGLFASSPFAFAGCGNVVKATPLNLGRRNAIFEMTNRGFHLDIAFGKHLKPGKTAISDNKDGRHQGNGGNDHSKNRTDNRADADDAEDIVYGVLACRELEDPGTRIAIPLLQLKFPGALHSLSPKAFKRLLLRLYARSSVYEGSVMIRRRYMEVKSVACHNYGKLSVRSVYIWNDANFSNVRVSLGDIGAVSVIVKPPEGYRVFIEAEDTTLNLLSDWHTSGSLLLSRLHPESLLTYQEAKATHRQNPTRPDMLLLSLKNGTTNDAFYALIQYRLHYLIWAVQCTVGPVNTTGAIAPPSLFRYTPAELRAKWAPNKTHQLSDGRTLRVKITYEREEFGFCHQVQFV